MIVRMKKVTVLVLETDRAQALSGLADLGVMHLAATNRVQGGNLDQARRDLGEAQSAHTILKQVVSEAASTPAPKTPADTVKEVQSLVAWKRELTEQVAEQDAFCAQWCAFGSFDPELVKSLTARGIPVRLFQVPVRESVAAPEGTTLIPLGGDGVFQCFALVGHAQVDVPWKEMGLPDQPLDDALAEAQAAKAELRKIDRTLAELAGSMEGVEKWVGILADHVRYLEADAGMSNAGRVAYLQGYCPSDGLEPVRQVADRQGWGLMVEDPAEGEPVPTLIRNPRWLRPIESLFSFIKILPGYHEVDVSAMVMVFLSIFFAMIVGDAGYGALFLVGTLWARARWKLAPRGPFTLMTLFSICTIAWGVLTGCYFGVAAIPAPLKALQVAWLSDQTNIMTLCLLIGVVHLSLAHLWNALRMLNSLRALAQLGWVAIVWTLFFAARSLIAGAPFPSWIGPVFIGGLVSVILFMTPVRRLKAELINHFMLPLSFFSAFGDLLSYMRLFALGVASVEVAGAFNTMAASFTGHPVVRILLAAMVLLLGHTLNIVLGAMSVLVHGIRLNALEFSMHLGLEWSGVEYKPFRAKQKHEKAG